ncbi:MAG: DUF3253 domain-containing protein [Pseudomonadota bacterium]
MKPPDPEIERALLAMAESRGTKSFCPSEVARALTEDWRPLMPDIRRVACSLPLLATQKGEEVDLASAKGPVRLRKGVTG